MTENELSNRIIGMAMKIYSELGPGLLEGVYKECLFHKITEAGFFVEKEKPIPVIYEKVKLECGYRIDLLIEKKLVLEIKSIDILHDVHLAQTLTYLRLGNYKPGLLINFNEARLKDSVRRVPLITILPHLPIDTSYPTAIHISRRTSQQFLHLVLVVSLHMTKHPSNIQQINKCDNRKPFFKIYPQSKCC